MQNHILTENRILNTDSYKVSHAKQYPPNLRKLLTYFESRGGEFPNVVWFGLQYLIKKHFLKPITESEVIEANQFCKAHLGPGYFPYEGWMYIVNTLGGKLPVKIRAVPEGSLIPNHNMLFRVESTDEKVPWVAEWLETMLVELWYPATVATYSYYCRQIILSALKKSCDDVNIPFTIPFSLHDFGFRGVSSVESAAIGGAAHLLNFAGSDTIVGIRMANKIYDHSMSAFSVAAMEHSTVTSWGREREFDAYTNFLDKFLIPKQSDDEPMKICAAVSDSFNIWNAIKNYWCREDVRQRIVNSNQRVVIRLDSGDPLEVVPKAIKMLDDCGYTSTINSKGYKVLPNCIRVLQGDGVNIHSIKEILNIVMEAGYSTENVVFGMGGALLQQHNRDTQKFALKACAALLGEEWISVSKDPVDDPGKRSKDGNLDLIKVDGTYMTIDRDKCEMSLMAFPSELETIFENGEIKTTYSLKEIRERLYSQDPTASLFLQL